ncbi:MAG TPA: ATP-binding cassette domain-containing protein [Terriglobia bacterium]|nr:ATP-binding cassette domain-containing protein [Terriglobia bacterium]
MFAVETEGLIKDYRLGFWRRRPRRALDGLSLQVEQSEVFGLLGPNGAGKSTTLKILLGLVFPTAGAVRLLGHDLRDRRVHQRLGYLPENPYFYDQLTAEELLSYAASLFGLRGTERRRRIGRLLERTGLEEVRDIPLGKFSKGMVQRVGIAQALINDPELVFLDEPMSGLDPLGRRDLRDLILELRAAGKTVFFSTHILSDAEMLCDRVAILNRGRLEGCGELGQLLSSGIEATEIVVDRPSPALVDCLGTRARAVVHTGERVRFTLPAECDPGQALALALHQGARIVSVNPVKMSLEDYFLKQVGRGSSPESGQPQAPSQKSMVEVSAPSADAHSRSGVGHAPRGNAASERVETRPELSGFQIQDSVRRVAAVALHTFKEAVRDNVLYSLIVFAVLLIGAAILFGSISVGIERIILVNLSLSAISVIGVLMAIFIGIGLVSKELERRSIHNVLSKPVRRAEFIVGKYAGLLLTLAVNTAVMTAAFYLALFYEQRAFDAADLVALEAVYFILLDLALVVGVALVFSTISTPVLSAVYTFAIYVIGNFSSDMRLFGHDSGSAAVERVTTVLYYLLPNFSNFSAITQAAHGERIPGYLLAANSLYALLYATILVSAAILIFEEREFR